MKVKDIFSTIFFVCVFILFCLLVLGIFTGEYSHMLDFPEVLPNETVEHAMSRYKVPPSTLWQKYFFSAFTCMTSSFVLFAITYKLDI